jgi:hypothetical protein
MSFYFLTWNFLNIFSEFYMKPSSSWLKFCCALMGHLYNEMSFNKVEVKPVNFRHV